MVRRSGRAGDQRHQSSAGTARHARERDRESHGGRGGGQATLLAIGKKGQNVRLAAKLTGWKIDIKNEEEKRREVEAKFEGFDAERAQADVAAALFAIEGFSEGMWQTLQESSLSTAERLIDLPTPDLAQILGTDNALAIAVQEAARSALAANQPATALDALFDTGESQADAVLGEIGTEKSAASRDAASEAAATAAVAVTTKSADGEPADGTDEVTAQTPIADSTGTQEPSE